MIIKLSKETRNKLLVCLLCILIFVYPLSSGGSPSTLFGALASVIVFFASFGFVINNGMNRKSFFVIVLTIAYLCISTMLILLPGTDGLKFGYARLLSIISTLIFFAIVINYEPSLKFCLKLLDVITIFLIIGNVLSLIDIGNFNEFLVSNYTQYLDFITRYHLGLGKPVFVFGVHNIAAFIYTGLFLISYCAYTLYKDRKHLIYAIIYICMLLALRCTTSIGYVAFCILVIVFFQTKSVKKMVITFILLCIGIVIAVFSGLFDFASSIMLKESNGFISRYFVGSDSLFLGNIQLRGSHWLGTGFCIDDGSGVLYGADSGWLINLTIGNVAYLVLFYELFVKCIRRNISGPFAFFAIIYVLVMEVGFVTFLYFRTISFVFVFVCIMKRLTMNNAQLVNMEGG